MSKSMISKIKLLVVITIVGVFVWIFILSPMVTFKTNEKKLEDAARRYYELNSNLLPTGERVGTVTLNTLYKKSYIDSDLFIPLTKKTCSVTNSWVKVRRDEDGDYKYYTYLECGVMTSSIDHKGPEIKLNGDTDITLGVGEEFKDPGVKSVVDNKDGKMDVKDVTVKGKVDTASVGTFEIEYSAKDSLGNTTTVVRNVAVVQKLNGMVKKDTGEKDYYTGENPNNYIYFSNMVFRIIGLEGSNVKIVADKDIANVNYNGIDEWFKYYENHLTDSSKKLIKESKFCNDSGNNVIGLKECSSYTKKQKFGLLSTIEINRVGNVGDNYLIGDTITWTNNSYDNNSVYAFRKLFSISNTNYATFDIKHNLGVRPVFVIDGEVLVNDGNGTYESPYKLEDYVVPKKSVEVNTRLTGEYIKISGILWRIVDVQSDGTTKVIAEQSMYDGDDLYTINYSSSSKVYNPKQKGNVGYIINNSTSKFFDTSYFVNHEISVPVYKGEPAYGKEKKTNTYKVKISAPNMYEMFSATTDDTFISSYWLLNTSSSANEVPGMSETGAVMYGMYSVDFNYGIRPVGYLSSKCIIKSGKGTKSSPYVISK